MASTREYTPTTLPKIDHRYQALKLLGAGLSGEIYQVQGPEGICALKLLRTEVPGLNQAELITAFKFEFSLLRGLQHPNIIHIYDFGFDDTLKRFYFTQEWIQGLEIQELQQKFSLKEMRNLFVQALQGLAYLHSHQVLHGDLKADNLLVTQNNDGAPLLKIIDFGISHPSFVQQAGTPVTMAPEKILKEPIDGRSDLYSLAVVFYTLITGRNPFLRNSMQETLRAHLNFSAPAAIEQRPECDPAWSQLLSKMLIKNPRDRIASAEACLKFLEIEGEDPHWNPPPSYIPETWMGRPEILLEANHFLEEIQKDGLSRILLVSGSTGLGKNNLLSELKYNAELKSIEVQSPDEKKIRTPALFFFKAEELPSLLKKDIPSLLKQGSIVSAMTPQQADSFIAHHGDLAVTRLDLRPLTEKETLHVLQGITRHRDIPAPFLKALHRLSGGYPARLREFLNNLLKDPQILDASGKWHLAPFREQEPSLEQLGLSENALAQALESELITDPKEHWQLGLKQIQALIRKKQWDLALKLLHNREKQLPDVFEGTEQQLQRAKILEKRGWIYTKQDRYQEAQECFTTALSLLSESNLTEPTLEIRLENFLAFLDLQSGNTESAVARYSTTAQQAQNLPFEKQKQITNNELGSAYLVLGRAQQAIEQLKKDLKLFKNLGDPVFKMKAYYNLAESYSRLAKHKKARQAYLKVENIARQERHWDYLVRAYNGLGNTSLLEKKNEESLDYYRRSRDLAEYLRDYLSAATIAQNRGVLLTELNRLPEALEDLELSKKLLGKVNSSSHSRYLMARAILELGEIHLKQKDYSRARSALTEAWNRAKEDQNLKNFRFYPLMGLAKLELEEKNFKNFQEIYPQLLHLAHSPTERLEAENLLKKIPQETSQDGKEIKSLEDVTKHKEQSGQSDFSSEALWSILTINRALIAEHNPETLFEKILQYASELSGAESALLLEVTENNELKVRSVFNTTFREAHEEISQQVARRVLETGYSLATQDALGDRNFNQFESVMALHLRSIACVPIRLYQKTIGLLYLTHRNKTRLFDPSILKIMEAFADQAGIALHNARQIEMLNRNNLQLQEKLQGAEAFIDQLKSDLRSRIKNPYPNILGKSPKLLEVLHMIDRIADTSLSVLILGETGSGKELIARAIHENSRRKKHPFIAVNCGAIPENLMESELFGYVSGAFTGATRNKKGLIEESSGGTLFLDEVGELAPALQVKLLRALQEKEIRPLGSNQSVAIDLRLVSATHQNLEDKIRTQKFREDFYYRLTEMVLTLPNLRERLEDLPLLAEHFLQESTKELGLKKTPRLGRSLLQSMMQYSWPGNIRELQNMLRTASAFAEHGMIPLENLPEFLRKKFTLSQSQPIETTEESQAPQDTNQDQSAKNLHEKSIKRDAKKWDEVFSYDPQWSWAQYEEAFFAKSLLRHQMNCEEAAKELQVGVATVYLKIRKYHLKTLGQKWETHPIEFSQGLSLQNLKRQVIQTSHKHLKSAYLVAKQLDLNVGTVYRFLKGE